MKNRRIGRFQITWELIEREPTELMKLFGLMIVVHTDQRFDTRTVEYMAFSKLFADIPVGVAAPFYRIEPSRNDEGELEWKAHLTTRDELQMPLRELPAEKPLLKR